MIMSFNDFIKCKLKNKATSNMKMQQVFGSIGLDNIDLYLRDGHFSSDIGIVNLHWFKGTHWVVHTNENYFDSYGCMCPRKLSKFNIKRTGYCSYSEYKIQGMTSKRDCICASYCL